MDHPAWLRATDHTSRVEKCFVGALFIICVGVTVLVAPRLTHGHPSIAAAIGACTTLLTGLVIAFAESRESGLRWPVIVLAAPVALGGIVWAVWDPHDKTAVAAGVLGVVLAGLLLSGLLRECFGRGANASSAPAEQLAGGIADTEAPHVDAAASNGR